ncbi:MAG TPA: transketolase [Planctomycetota bacterium]
MKSPATMSALSAAPVRPTAPANAVLAAHANRMRRDVVRMAHAAGCGHPGGPLGLAEIFSVLYFERMALDPAQAGHPDRDRLVLSNGHCCAILYTALARRGFFPVEELHTFRKFGSHLQGHPHLGALPGIEMSTGSLGNGVSVAAGMALAHKLDGRAARVYAITSDGENQEGQPWEMATSAVHYGLDNLTLVLDWNGIQIDGRTADVMDTGDLAAKWRAFGWHVEEVDGHDLGALRAAFDAAEAETGRPSLIAARTTIGKGVSFMEDTSAFHGKAPNDAEAVLALGELGDPAPERLDHGDRTLWLD